MNRAPATYAALTLAALSAVMPACDRHPAQTPVPRQGVPAPPATPALSTLSAVDRWNILKLESLEGIPLRPDLAAQIAAYADRAPVAQSKILSGQDLLSATVLDSLIQINTRHCAAVMQLKDSALEVLRKRSALSGDFASIVDADVAVLLQDPAYQEKLRKALGEKPIDCKEVSTTLLLCMLLRFEQTNLGTAPVKLKFVSGLCFDPNYVPDGIGHNWIEFDGKVFDWAIKTDGKMTIVPASSTSYVPLVWSLLTYTPSSQRAEAEVRILRAPVP